MTWSDWHSLRSDGTIPDELVPCEYWQLKWLIEWSLTAPENSFGDTLKGRWVWHIAQNTSDVFNSEVRVTGTAVWLSDPLFGGTGDTLLVVGGAGPHRGPHGPADQARDPRS